MADVTIPSVPEKAGSVTVKTVMVSYTVALPGDEVVNGHLHISGDRIPATALAWLETKLVGWLERMETP